MVDTAKIAKNLRKAIDNLRKERDELDDKIAVLENTLTTLGVSGRGPGRPKGTKGGRKTKQGRRKPNWSPEARKAAAERMRKYWADRRKKEGKKKTSKKKRTAKKTGKKTAKRAKK